MNRKDEILVYIISYIQKHGYSPSYAEIGAGVGLKSLSSVYVHVNKMLQTGMLETDAGESTPRAIRVPGYKFVRKEG